MKFKLAFLMHVCGDMIELKWIDPEDVHSLSTLRDHGSSNHKKTFYPPVQNSGL